MTTERIIAAILLVVVLAAIAWFLRRGADGYEADDFIEKS